MKKSILLLFAGAIAITAGAQERQVNIHNRNQDNGKNLTYSDLKDISDARHSSSAAAKTTSVPNRWYFYGDFLSAYETAAAFGTSTYPEFLAPWKDTLAKVYFTGGTGGPTYITMVSDGTIVVPSDSIAFNQYTYFPGDMKVTSSTPFTVDSVEIEGVYGLNVADSNVVDTLRLTFIHGSLAGSSGFTSGSVGGTHWGSGSITFPSLPYDTVTEISEAPGSTAPPSDGQVFLLNNHSAATGGGIWSGGNNVGLVAGPAWGDTTGGTNSGVFVLDAALNNPMTAVPGSQALGVSVTFFSGRTGPLALPGDTLADYNEPHSEVNFGGGDYKYNSFRHYSLFAASDGSATATPEWPFYNDGPYAGLTNNNTGLYKTLPDTARGWGGTYIPTWAWSSSAGAADVQYPWIELHLTCATCGVVTAPVVVGPNAVHNVSIVNSINAYPNPTNGTLNIVFNLAQSSAVSVTLTNMVGEVVATQNMGTVATGKAVINTANLPEGMYIYTLTANGVRSSTGHVAIAH